MAWEADPSARGAVRLWPTEARRGPCARVRHASGEIRDAGLSHPAQRIPDLVKPSWMGTSDMCDRQSLRPGGFMPGWPAKRRLMSRAAALLAVAHRRRSAIRCRFLRLLRRERLLEAGVRAEGFKDRPGGPYAQRGDCRGHGGAIEFRIGRGAYSKMDGA